jgi:hypothetical protein
MAKLDKLKPTQSDTKRKMVDMVKAGLQRGDTFEKVKTLRGNIVDGHHRVQARKEMGYKTVPSEKATRGEVLRALKKASRNA